jgi:hypothetical protein
MSPLRRNQCIFIFVIAVLLGGGLWFPSLASAGVGNICSGTCVIPYPTYVSLYWDSSPEQWDLDVNAVSTGMGHARVDAFVKALTKSTYFVPLDRNYGVSAPRTRESITSACAKIPANVDESFDKVTDLIRCVLKANPELVAHHFFGNVIFNVFLPPQVVNTGYCEHNPDGSHHIALHEAVYPEGAFLPLYAVTINPTTSVCNANFKSLVDLLAHEMVEAATDPVPDGISGFKVFLLGDKGGSEIGDLCENTFTPFLFSAVTQYWSSSADCRSGHRERPKEHQPSLA